ncbi:unnamed protein product [Calypogeia fissa]
MGSITESVGSGRSTVRRYSAFQTRLQRWNKGSPNGELPPQLQNGGTHLTRTPALDLAQQAQLAACNYLGYSPRDLPNEIFHAQGPASDRPLEVHMHHYHHHYVAPASPFSQTSSQCCEGPAAHEIPGAATTKLALRANSPPVSALPNTNSNAIYPALALRAPSVLPQLIHTLHDGVQNPPQPLQNGAYVGDVEAAHRYMQNVLWLKNQIDHGPDRAVNHWQERRVDSAVTGRELRSPDSGYMRPITSERRPVRRGKKFLWPRGSDDSHESSSGQDDDVKRTKFKTSRGRDMDSARLLLQKCEKMKAFRNNNSPYSNSPSADNSVTDDSARSVSLLSVKCQRSPRVCVTIRKTKMIENGDPPSATIEPPSQQICRPQARVRPEGCLACPSWPSTGRRDLKSSCRARSPSDDTTSSFEIDSGCSSVKVSVHRRTRRRDAPTNSSSSSAGSDTQLKEGRPPKKGCGARAYRRQAARDARAWDQIERKPRKISCRANTKLEDSVQPESVYPMDSASKAQEQDLDDRHNNVLQEKSCLQDMCMEENEREDKNRSRDQRLESHTRPLPQVETSKKTNVTEHVEKEWNPCLGSNRGHQHISIEHDRLGVDEPKCQSLQEDPYSSFSPRTVENKMGDYSSHNKLREAVEAAWNTNLGTKRSLGDYYMNVSSDHKSSNQVFPTEILQGDSRATNLFPFSAGGRAHSCPWKVRLGMKNGVGEDSKNKAPEDPIFQNIHKEQENLRALVAREESLQRELNDQTVARVAAEERARVTAEEKAHIYEASAKAAEEGLRVLLDERALFHCKFKEELEKGATDRLRLQELLHLEKVKLESSETELREVRRSFQDSLAVGTRALPSKNMLQDHRLDGLSVNVVAPHGLGAGHDEGRLPLITESEKRIAAEAKASHFEASAKIAEERLRSLLDERNWFYSRFKEELEQNNTDMKKLQQLMELERSNNGLAHPQQKQKVDDGQRPPRNGARLRMSFGSRLDEGLAPTDKDRHRLGPLQEFEEPPDEPSQSSCTCDPEIFDYKQAQVCFGEDQKSSSSIDIYESRDIRYKRPSNERSIIKNEKKRPLSPVIGSRVRHWKSADGPLSVKVERCNGRDGETTTVLDIAPGSSRLDSLELNFRENPDSPNGFRLAAGDLFDFKENTFDSRESADIAALENSAQRSRVNDVQSMPSPTKWKKDTKAELRRMIQEQEKTWKIAEDAVEELGRRLELLERYKMEIQDTLGRTRAMGNIDLFFKRLQENLGDYPRGFNSLYNSQIYEEGKALNKCPLLMERKGGCATVQDVCTSPTRPDFSKDSEIEKLKIEVAQLRVELQQRDSERSDSPKLKSAFQFSPRSQPLVADADWSEHFMSGFEIPLQREGISPMNPTTPQVIPEQMEPELANDSFEEMKTTHTRKDGSQQYTNGKADIGPCDIFPPRTIELDMEDRGWVLVPNEHRDKSASPMFMENDTCQTEQMDYQETSAPQEDVCLSSDLNSDEGKLQVLKTALHKLSRIFLEQEEKLKIFKLRYKKEDAKNSQAEHVKNVYLDTLKEMSQQLGELCHDLHAKTQPDEVPLKQERISHNNPLQRLVQKFQRLEKRDNPAPTTKDVEIPQQLQNEYMDTSQFSTNKLKCIDKQFIKGEEYVDENVMADSESLRNALQAAESKIEEQTLANLSLMEKLDSGSQDLLNVQTKHAQEVARKDQSINYAKQLNSDLSNDMSQTETSLVEIKSRYKSLVSTLEQQLEDVKTEALSLQDAVNNLKEEIVTRENLVSNLEAEAKDHKVQIEQLRSRIEGMDNDTSENVQEKLELSNSLEAMRREMDVQQCRITELISINEDLIAFSESKEDEIMGLRTTMKSLQQCVDEKSAEAEKLSAETLAFSQDLVETRQEGEAYRLGCTALKLKLEEIEYELLAREASMERLTQHLGKTIEGQDFILEEKEQLLCSLNRAQYKEHRLDDQVWQSKIIIQDLEEKLNSMDAEMNEARLELADMKAKGMEALLMEQQAGEMRNRVHKLEEEIMEKEGQISILKTSYPGEYTSTF